MAQGTHERLGLRTRYRHSQACLKDQRNECQNETENSRYGRISIHDMTSSCGVLGGGTP